MFQIHPQPQKNLGMLANRSLAVASSEGMLIYDGPKKLWLIILPPRTGNFSAHCRRFIVPGPVSKLHKDHSQDGQAQALDLRHARLQASVQKLQLQGERNNILPFIYILPFSYRLVGGAVMVWSELND